ncbi:hypothetical protein QCD79_34330, partial [Pseudomonas quasicaspiana]|nr:hypothetical protein [Pseudomonas quasicaspiana]
MHHQLASLIDAENLYLALYDSDTDKITYPYYVEICDVDVIRVGNLVGVRIVKREIQVLRINQRGKLM